MSISADFAQLAANPGTARTRAVISSSVSDTSCNRSGRSNIAASPSDRGYADKSSEDVLFRIASIIRHCWPEPGALCWRQGSCGVRRYRRDPDGDQSAGSWPADLDRTSMERVLPGFLTRCWTGCQDRQPAANPYRATTARAVVRLNLAFPCCPSLTQAALTSVPASGSRPYPPAGSWPRRRDGHATVGGVARSVRGITPRARQRDTWSIYDRTRALPPRRGTCH